ncbi:hypothetical protein HOE425_330656 [Hoeflea sp. EC-HK425]|nr:hypothetical protein HOE425_330656 [Hoeflea sp. EC-HK425]
MADPRVPADKAKAPGGSFAVCIAAVTSGLKLSRYRNQTCWKSRTFTPVSPKMARKSFAAST